MIRKEWLDNIRKDFKDVADAIELRKPARVPVLFFGINPYSASFCGVKFSDTMLDKELYVECIVKLVKHFQPDVVMNVNSAIGEDKLKDKKVIEKEGVKYLVDSKTGKEVLRIPDDGNPQEMEGDGILRGSTISRAISDMKEIDPNKIQTTEERYIDWANTDTISMVKDKLRDSVLLSIGSQNPVSNVVAILGFERAFVDIVENSELVRRLTNIYTEININTAIAKIKAGAKFIYTGSSWLPLVNRDVYKDFFHEAQCKLNKKIHENGGIVLLHVSGRQSHIMDFNVEAEPDVMLIDGEQNDISIIKKGYGDRVCLAGGLDPTNILYRGTPEIVEKEIKRLIKAAGDNGGYILSTSDNIVLNTPTENIETMMRVASEAYREG